MIANIIPAIVGVIITVILASILINKGNKVQSYEILEKERTYQVYLNHYVVQS